MNKTFILVGLFIFIFVACENKHTENSEDKKQPIEKTRTTTISGYNFIDVNDDEVRSIIDRNLQMCGTYMLFEGKIDKNFSLPTKMAIEYNRGKFNNLNTDFIAKHLLPFDKITTKMINLCNRVIIIRDNGEEGKFIDAFPSEGYNTKFTKDDAFRHSTLKLFINSQSNEYRKVKAISENLSNKLVNKIYNTYTNMDYIQKRTQEETVIINLIKNIEEDDTKTPNALVYYSDLIFEVMGMKYLQDKKLGAALILWKGGNIQTESDFYKFLNKER